MSASTENLLQRIKEVQEKISVSEKEGNDPSELIEQLSVLNSKLQAASQALNESKQILKG